MSAAGGPSSGGPPEKSGPPKTSGPAKKSGWPKGPFPEKWAFPVVEKRLASAWDEPTRHQAWHALLASGAVHLAPLDDLYVRAFSGAEPSAVEALEAAGITVFDHAAQGARPIEGAKVALPTLDLFDALVALGVAGPHHGIGNRAIVRFLVQARAFATITIETAGEDLLILRLHAKGPDAAALLAERLPHIAPTVQKEGLLDALLSGQALHLDWSPS